jgi:hypothetical protein
MATHPLWSAAMRKMLLALFTMFFMASLVVAVEVTALSYDKDKKELKVKEGDAEKTYKIGDKTKFTTTDFKGENPKESSLAAFEKSFSKIGKKGRKMDIKTEKDTVTEATWKAGGKKKN